MLTYKDVATATFIGISLLLISSASGNSAHGASLTQLYLSEILNYCVHSPTPKADFFSFSLHCPPYFQGNTSVPCWYLGNKCYCFSSFRLPTWMRCDEYCKGGNMTLLSLETEAEDMLINSHVQANPELNFSEYWTSGRYSQEGNNRWEWASTQPFQPFNYTNWHPIYNQPDDNEPGSCALLYFLDYTGYWADNVCIYSTRFVCESIE
ncbi:asialoglycoprotein receptor 2-like isoform X1 [Daphnia pulicaria]|uniref:asialoglycoprotein receptor 2-like isoform X1 n=1 Tax=Daphnia pulicaria TaxID=35523 RepID=UPI001EE9E4C5|nr:asialoglycoprotein receptor 2-like isoform X1 [Daphnia pulicaria]